MQCINVGINDLHIFQDGWYGLEKSPEGLLFRASSSQATLKFEGMEGRCKIILLFSARPEHTGEPLCGSVYGNCDEGSTFEFSIDTNRWCVREGMVDLDPNGLIHIQIKNPWSPDALYQNGDARSLGLMLSAVRIEKRPRIQSNSLWANLQEAQY
jgi:hypothetical protein